MKNLDDRRPATFSGRKASQMSYELNRFVELLIARGVTRYLEIGARHGDTFHHIMCSLPPGSRGVAVDLPGAKWGVETSVKTLKAVCEDLNKRGYVARCILGDSTNTDTFEKVIECGPYDAILIDGDHRLPGVTRDWELYGPLAPCVAFHDIVGTGQQERDGSPVEVPVLWRRLIEGFLVQGGRPDAQGTTTKYINKDGRVAIEFVAAGSAMGIGVICQ